MQLDAGVMCWAVPSSAQEDGVGPLPADVRGGDPPPPTSNSWEETGIKPARPLATVPALTGFRRGTGAQPLEPHVVH